MVACWLAYRDMRLSVQLMLWLETISVALILVLFFLPGRDQTRERQRITSVQERDLREELLINARNGF